jgi:hypothetical protein
MLKGRGSGDFFSEVLAGPIHSAGRQQTVFQCRMVNIQTVNEVDVESASSEIACQIKKAEGLGPEVISRKVIDPGIYKNQ